MPCRLAMALCAALVSFASADVHVAPTGDDANAGNAGQPVATVARALELIKGQAATQTIVLHEGVYRESVEVGRQGAPPALLITAAPRDGGGYADVVFEGGYSVDGAQPVAGLTGVYRTKYPATFNSYQSHRTLWEADVRLRYREVADTRAVAAWPGSFSFEADGYLYFHTSDDQPPDTHDIGYSISDSTFAVWADNVTVRGIKFRSATGIGVGGANVCVEDCDAWNIEQIAFYVSATAKDAKILRCTGRDLGSGVKSEGTNTLVEGCRFFRIHDAFESHLITQDASGIQFYHPARGGTIRDNLVVGFHTGVFVKGVYDAVVIEGNTAVGGDYGIGIVHWHPGSTIRNNIVSDCHTPYIVAVTIGGRSQFLPTAVFRDNIMWNAKSWENVRDCMTLPQAAGSGQGVVMADPRFASAQTGDYRLLPDSPALASTSGAAHMGAFTKVGDDWKDTTAPQITVAAESPAKMVGRIVETYFEQDHWHAGAAGRALRETRYEPYEGNRWLLPEPTFQLRVIAADNATGPAMMKLRRDEGAWSDARPFEPLIGIELPQGASRTSISVQVADRAGNWSQPSTFEGYVTADAPQLAGDVSTYANDLGFAAAFRTNMPCFAKMQWGLTTGYGHTVEQAANCDYNWDANAGGEWTVQRVGQRDDHHFAVVAPQVAAGQTIHYRFVLDDGIGNVWQSPDATIVLRGTARTIHVDPVVGRDIEGAGGSDQPWRTIQFAVNRALPGDRVLLHDGIYSGSATITHGGTQDAPLVVAAENTWQATLDGAKVASSLLEVHQSPWVELRGIEFRWFGVCGLQLRDSAHVSIDQCKFRNNLLTQGRRDGTGYSARYCPDMTVTGNLFYFMNDAFCLLDSPRFHMTDNTAVAMLHRACRIVFSCEGSTFSNNCFTFTGNDHLQGLETQASWASFICDYNNFAAHVREASPRRPDPEDDIQRWPGSHWIKQSKGINLVNILDLPQNHPMNQRCFSLKEWQERSGKDAHSIFKRPLYVDPLHGDFHVQPGSPNIGAGQNGALIGALGPTP